MGAEEDAIARRERLKALRAAKELLSTPEAAAAGDQRNGDAAPEDQAEQAEAKGVVDAHDNGSKQSTSTAEESEEAEEDNGMPTMKFRNYLPHDEQLRGAKVAPVTLPKFEDPIAADAVEPKKFENPFGNIAPKNPNWDLKRDVQKRLAKLEKRTQKALYEMMLEQQKVVEEASQGISDEAEDWLK